MGRAAHPLVISPGITLPDTHCCEVMPGSAYIHPLKPTVPLASPLSSHRSSALSGPSPPILPIPAQAPYLKNLLNN